MQGGGEGGGDRSAGYFVGEVGVSDWQCGVTPLHVLGSEGSKVEEKMVEGELRRKDSSQHREERSKIRLRKKTHDECSLTSTEAGVLTHVPQACFVVFLMLQQMHRHVITAQKAKVDVSIR